MCLYVSVELFACRRWRVVHSAVRVTYLDKRRAEISRNRWLFSTAGNTCCPRAIALGALGVQSVTSHPGPGSSEAHPAAGRMIGIGLRAREP